MKPLLSKINFALCRNPEIVRVKNWRDFIPEQYETVILISSDFELAWAWQFVKKIDKTANNELSKARLERENLPKILALCEKYKIPITWATVGHLFLESCNRINGKAHPELHRLDHFENDFWRYNGNDWFENDPCTDFKTSPEWYCPDLIRLILDSPIKHEIGCHTFSHIDCRDGVCSPELLRAELKECKNLANRWNINLKSFVHPGYTIGNLKVLAEEGFTNYRTNNRNVLGYPIKHSSVLWEFEQTAEFVYRKDWSIDYHIYRYITIIKRAIKTNTVCALWFHPSFNPKVIERIWPEVFQFINENREQIWLGTHGEYVDWLEKTNC
jgi:peptidoglycan/xylan/chitin deacetylase (PgdA/CDA1 family)